MRYMNERFPVAVMLSFLALFTAAGVAAAADDSDSALNDGVVETRIQMAIAMNDSLSVFAIDTEVKRGIAVLTGSVADPIDKELAGNLAGSFDDVKEVVNRIEVSEKARRHETPAWRRNLDDAATNANVRRRLAYHSGIRTAALALKVEGSTVHVSGTVESEEQLDAIVSVIEDTAGVEKVEAKLEIEAEEEPEESRTMGSIWEDAKADISDEWTEKRLETLIMLSRTLSISNIDVEVGNGVAVLTGTVDSEAKKEMAGTTAKNCAGVQEVVNRLQVK